MTEVTHYGFYRADVPQSPMIKDACMFREQNGHFSEWGKAWEPIYDCNTIGDARRKFAELKGIKLAAIYDGEP